MPDLAAAGYRVVAVDYRGAGESEKPLDGYD
jgi:pimeloyl-ACP methyl ester carboxylesterase